MERGLTNPSGRIATQPTTFCDCRCSLRSYPVEAHVTDTKVQSLKGKTLGTTNSKALSVVDVKAGKAKKSKAGTAKKSKVKASRLHADALNVMRRSMATFVLQRSSILLEKSEFDKRYVSIDMKGSTASSQFDDRLKVVDLQIAQLRSMARDMFGSQKVKITVASDNDFIAPSTVSGYAFNISVDPTSLTEFVAAAALFDEFRVTSGRLTLLPLMPTASTLNARRFDIVAYDPSDITALSGVQAGITMQQHILFPSPCCMTAAGYYASSEHKLDFHVPSGILLASDVAGESWQPTTTSGSAALPYGTIKSWWESAHVNTAVISRNILQYHVEFRCRQ